MKFAREIAYSRYLLFLALSLAVIAIAGFVAGMEKQRSYESVLQMSNSLARVQTEATIHLFAYVQSGYVRDLQQFRSESTPIVELARAATPALDTETHSNKRGHIEEAILLAGFSEEELSNIRKHNELGFNSEIEGSAWQGILDHHYRTFDISRRLLRDHVYGRMDQTRTRDYLKELHALNGQLFDHQALFEVRIQEKKDAVGKWTRRAVSLFVVAGFFVIGFIGMYVENGWKRHEEEIQKSRSRYQKLMEQAGTGMIQVSSDGELTWASKAAADIFVCDSVEDFMETMGNFERVFMDPERKTEFKKLLSDTGVLSNFMFRAARKDGKPIWLLCNARMVRGKDGRISYYEASFQDYTTYRKNNQDLHYLAGVLRGLAFSIYQLLLVRDFDKAVGELLKILGKAADIDRITIYRFNETPDEGCHLQFEWVKYDSLSIKNNKDTSDVHFEILEPGVHDKFVKGKMVQLVTNEMEDNKLQEYLKQLKVHVTMMAPIYSGEHLWGIIGFDNCSNDEKWNAEIRHVLKTIAGALGHHSQNAQMEGQLTETKDRYRTLVGTIKDAVFQVNEEGELQYVNTAWSTITRYPELDCIGNDIYDFVHYDDRDQLREDFRDLLKNKTESLKKEYRLISGNGETRWLEWSCLVMRDPKTAGRHIYGTLYDVTERKKLEKELTQNRKKLESMIESTPLAISGIESDGRVTLWNRNAEDTYGWKREEVLGKDAPEVPETGKEEHLDLIDRVLSGEQTKKIEVERKRKNKSNIFISLSAAPLFDSRGKVDQVLLFAQDISQAKMSREAIRKSLKEKNVLLSEIHHRVKNNMAVISGLLSLKAQEQSDPKMASLLKESEYRIQSMAMIHEKLYQTDTFAEIEFGSYLNDLTQYIENHYKEEGAVIETSVETEEIYLEISQAVPCGLFINEIITNGYRHAFVGRDCGKIHISMKMIEGLCELFYKDDGVGFPEDVVSGKGGQSLGLTLIRGLGKQLKGELETGNDNGAYFRLLFKIM